MRAAGMRRRVRGTKDADRYGEIICGYLAGKPITCLRVVSLFSRVATRISSRARWRFRVSEFYKMCEKVYAADLETVCNEVFHSFSRLLFLLMATNMASSRWIQIFLFDISCIGIRWTTQNKTQCPRIRNLSILKTAFDAYFIIYTQWENICNDIFFLGKRESKRGAVKEKFFKRIDV